MEVIKYLQSFASPFWDKFFIGATLLGEVYFAVPAMALIFWCFQKDWGYRLGFAYLSSGVLNLTIKEIFQAPRPIGQPGIRSLFLKTAPGYSFPSGHTQNIASLAASFGTHFKKSGVCLIGVMVIIMVALSRLYLGVHTPADVACGAVIGIGWVFVSNWIFDYAERRKNRSIFAVPVILILAGLYFFPAHNYYKAAGASFGFLLGYFIEPRYINFSPQASLGKQIIKYLFGMAVLLAIEFIGKRLLPALLICDFFRYLLMGVWVTIIAPYLFKSMFKDVPGMA
jgi:membrane-associated phospholipid phosphatase